MTTHRRPVKQSAALAVRRGDELRRVLLVRRPEHDPEFPGMWGLPAASCGPGETPEQAAQRVGEQKLGVPVRLGRRLSLGRQERPTYVLEMHLYEAWLDGPAPRLPLAEGAGPEMTLYTAWRWGEPAELSESARNGSLCSQLLLESSRLF